MFRCKLHVTQYSKLLIRVDAAIEHFPTLSRLRYSFNYNFFDIVFKLPIHYHLVMFRGSCSFHARRQVLTQWSSSYAAQKTSSGLFFGEIRATDMWMSPGRQIIFIRGDGRALGSQRSVVAKRLLIIPDELIDTSGAMLYYTTWKIIKELSSHSRILAISSVMNVRPAAGSWLL